jgi:myosin-5
MPEGLLQLEHLMQATKLLQLKKVSLALHADQAELTFQATLGDIEILFDVCWILSPSQIQKLISQYHNADYEAPISPDILKAVAARVRPEDKNDQLLLQTEQDEVGPYQIPPPRDIAGLETCTYTRRALANTSSRCSCLAQRSPHSASGYVCCVMS